MVSRLNGRLPWLVACIAALSLAIATPVLAQSTGMIKGVVKDDKGQPVEGAKVVIEMSEGAARKFETKSSKKGEFIQIGLKGGAYKVSAEKDKLVRELTGQKQSQVWERWVSTARSEAKIDVVGRREPKRGKSEASTPSKCCARRFTSLR